MQECGLSGTRCRGGGCRGPDDAGVWAVGDLMQGDTMQQMFTSCFTVCENPLPSWYIKKQKKTKQTNLGSSGTHL